MSNALIATNLLLGLLDRATQINMLLNTARNEGRDVSGAELDALFAADVVARDQLDAAIAAARAAAPAPATLGEN